MPILPEAIGSFPSLDCIEDLWSENVSSMIETTDGREVSLISVRP